MKLIALLVCLIAKVTGAFNSGITKSYENGSWYAHYSYECKDGIVLIFQDHNVMRKKSSDTTRFDTVINGRNYQMVVEAVAFSDAGLKRMANNFLKECIKKEQQ